MTEFLALTGFVFLASVGIGLIFAGLYELKDRIDHRKYLYRVKHRFDKPPTAKCYCRDCARHDNESGRCYKFKEWLTADCWFCWDAEPRKKEDEDK